MLLGHPAYDQNENVEKNANLVWDPVTLAWVKETQPAGGGGAVTIADGADVAEGATTDAAVTGDVAGSVSAKLRGLNKILTSVWDSVNTWIKVSVQNSTLTAIQGSPPWSVTFTAATVNQGSAGTAQWPVTFTQASVTFTAVSQGTAGASAWPVTFTALPAGTNTIGVVTFTAVAQGTAGASPWPVTFTALPAGTNIIGTLTATQGTAAAVSGAWPIKVTDGTDTLLVTAAGSAQVDLFSLAGTSLTANEGASGSGTQRVTLATHSSVENNPIGAVTLGNSVNKTQVTMTGFSTTASTVAQQVIVTRTVTSGKTLYVNYISASASLSPTSVTAANLGTMLFQAGGNTLIVQQFANSTTAPHAETDLQFAEPLFFASGTVVRMAVSPFTASTIAWAANFGGYEK